MVKKMEKINRKTIKISKLTFHMKNFGFKEKKNNVWEITYLQVNGCFLQSGCTRQNMLLFATLHFLEYLLHKTQCLSAAYAEKN